MIGREWIYQYVTKCNSRNSRANKAPDDRCSCTMRQMSYFETRGSQNFPRALSSPRWINGDLFWKFWKRIFKISFKTLRKENKFKTELFENAMTKCLAAGHGPKKTKCPAVAEFFTEFPPKLRFFKLLRNIRCLLRNVTGFQKLTWSFSGQFLRACAHYNIITRL